MSEKRTIPVAEWLSQARSLFGDDPKKWRFKCPVCGHSQTLADFEAIGAEPQSAYTECIGRYLLSRASGLGSKSADGGKKSPCDYAAFGLFRLSPAPEVVPDGGGKPVAVFAFDVEVK